MRHLGSIVLSVILAPVIYVLAGIGMVRLEAGQAASTNWTDVGIGVGALVVAGALYAVLTMMRLSPLGPVIASLLYIIIQLWALFVSESKIVSTLGTSVFGSQGAAEAPLVGTTLLLAIPLLGTIFSPRRWRAKDKPVVATAYAPPVGQSTYPQPGVPQPGLPQPGVPQPGFPQADAPQSPAQPVYSTPDTQTYAAPPAPAGFPQPTYSQPAYPQPTSAAPSYTSAADATAPEQTSVPQPSTPQQTSAATADDAIVEEPTVIEHRPDTTN